MCGNVLMLQSIDHSLHMSIQGLLTLLFPPHHVEKVAPKIDCDANFRDARHYTAYRLEETVDLLCNE